MKKIGVVANCTKPETREALERLTRKAGEYGATLFASGEASDVLPSIQQVSSEDLGEEIDLLVALGGDGTMLRAVRLLGAHDVPLLGVNLGGLGFMTTVPEQDLERAFDHVQRGDYHISKRTRAACTVMRGDEEIGRFLALNDITLGWGESSRVVTLDVTIDGEEVTSFVCDGLILSTPTGSTGHSLSANGPIVHPDVCAFVLCPICPHTLSNRPVVIPDNGEIVVTITDSPKELLFSSDGQGQLTVHEGDRLVITRSPHPAHLVVLPDYSYFALLRQKLHWRGSSL